MFFPDPAAIACCAATCACGVGSFCAYRNRQSIPHPSECSLIGICMRRLGCHDHDKFDMLVEVHDILNIQGNGQFSVELQAGRFFARTSQGEAIKTRVEIQVRAHMHACMHVCMQVYACMHACRWIMHACMHLDF